MLQWRSWSKTILLIKTRPLAAAPSELPPSTISRPSIFRSPHETTCLIKPALFSPHLSHINLHFKVAFNDTQFVSLLIAWPIFITFYVLLHFYSAVMKTPLNGKRRTFRIFSQFGSLSDRLTGWSLVLTWSRQEMWRYTTKKKIKREIKFMK